MIEKSGPRRYLKILLDKEKENRALVKLKEFGKLLISKNNRKRRQKALKELKELAKDLCKDINK
jgi:hypothetical protein